MSIINRVKTVDCITTRMEISPQELWEIYYYAINTKDSNLRRESIDAIYFTIRDNIGAAMINLQVNNPAGQALRDRDEGFKEYFRGLSDTVIVVEDKTEYIMNAMYAFLTDWFYGQFAFTKITVLVSHVKSIIKNWLKDTSRDMTADDTQYVSFNELELLNECLSKDSHDYTIFGSILLEVCEDTIAWIYLYYKDECDNGESSITKYYNELKDVYNIAMYNGDFIKKLAEVLLCNQNSGWVIDHVGATVSAKSVDNLFKLLSESGKI